MRLNKARPCSLIHNKMVADPEGIWVLLSEIIEKKDYDTATVKTVKNENKDGNESDEYVMIECSEFQLQLTPNDIKILQERHDNKPHIKRPSLPKIKKVNIADPKAKSKKEGKKSDR